MTDKLNIVNKDTSNNINTVTKSDPKQLDSPPKGETEKDFTDEKWAMLRIVGGRKVIPSIFKCY